MKFLKSIDLNCDMGEGMPNDASIMPYITSANIACGFHAGDEDTMRRTIELALEHKVKIGAHPGFDDKENFGRKPMELTEHQYEELIIEQLEIIDTICLQMGATLHHVKPHGALYNMSAEDPALARMIANAVKLFNDALILYGLSGSCSISEAEAIGIKTASEVFADRTYRQNGTLTPRSEANALITGEEASAEQVLGMITQNTVIANDRSIVNIVPDTVCIHGDGEQALSFAKYIYSTLQQHDIPISAIRK